jgi:hypothetical protein
MLSEEEKKIIEKFIEFHKKRGGEVSHDSRLDFTMSLKRASFFDINPIISKSIALGLIKYLFSDRTGWTTLTKVGWDFKNFNEFDKLKLNQQEIDKITIDKLKTDLRNSKRQSFMFWPLTLLTIILGLTTIYYSTKEQNTDLIKNLETRIDKVDSVVNDLNDKIEQVHYDISRHDSTSLIKD